jgi:hypothetical protein
MESGGGGGGGGGEGFTARGGLPGLPLVYTVIPSRAVTSVTGAGAGARGPGPGGGAASRLAARAGAGGSSGEAVGRRPAAVETCTPVRGPGGAVATRGGRTGGGVAGAICKEGANEIDVRNGNQIPTPPTMYPYTRWPN